MAPFWSSFLQELKHCGKRGPLFLVVLPLVFIGALIVNKLAQTTWDKSVVYSLVGGTVGVLAALLVKAFTMPPRERYEQRPLSDDERRVAVEKLRRAR
jgi:hypothetical protein